MSDLISRQAAIDEIRRCRFVVDAIEKINGLPSAQPEPLTLRVNHELTKEEYDKLMHDIKDAPIVLLPPAQPSADVVEVVRCKDCKHYVVHSFFGRSQGWCERLCDEFDKSLARGTEPDDYCSRAEPYKGKQE